MALDTSSNRTLEMRQHSHSAEGTRVNILIHRVYALQCSFNKTNFTIYGSGGDENHFSPLVDSDGLGKITGCIRVDTTHHCQLISDQLNGENCTKSRHWSVARNDERILIKSISQLLFIGNDDDIGSTCLNLLGSRSHVMGMLIVKDKHDDWGGSLLAILVILNQCKRPMLQCSTAVSLGMQIAHLLNLQCTLHGNCLSISLSKDEAVILSIQPLGDTFALLPILQCHSATDGQSH
mmetsp:Transcript_18358/g.39651  ORF Transcript_18358/g.39651 Transcript_18358/m.39651 type:complete len:236 (+) Transcript_18358:128-835(+)